MFPPCAHPHDRKEHVPHCKENAKQKVYQFWRIRGCLFAIAKENFERKALNKKRTFNGIWIQRQSQNKQKKKQYVPNDFTSKQFLNPVLLPIKRLPQWMLCHSVSVRIKAYKKNALYSSVTVFSKKVINKDNAVFGSATLWPSEPCKDPAVCMAKAVQHF